MSNPTELPDLDRLKDEHEAFEEWARNHLGQGYPLTMDEHVYEHPVTRWTFKAWKASAARRAQPEGEAPQAEPVGEVVLFGGECKEISWAKGKLPPVGTKLYAHRPAATLSPLCGAQHAESGAPTQAAYDILLEVCRGAAHALIAARDMVEHPDHVAFIDRALANPGLLAQQAAAPEDVDLRKDEATRLRRVVRAMGIDHQVPGNDARLRDCLFSVLGIIAGKLESAPGTPEAPSDQDAKDAARYRVLRNNSTPLAVARSMRIEFVDLGPDESIESRIDSLCDQFIAAQLDGGQEGSESNG